MSNIIKNRIFGQCLFAGKIKPQIFRINNVLTILDSIRKHVGLTQFRCLFRIIPNRKYMLLS